MLLVLLLQPMLAIAATEEVWLSCRLVSLCIGDGSDGRPGGSGWQELLSGVSLRFTRLSLRIAAN